MELNLRRHCANCVMLYFACLVNLASPNGQFYVGFLGFANLHNLNYQGECCDGQATENGCLDFCDLVFEVSVKGIDSDPASGKRPSEHPIDNENAILFPTSYEGVINPMTFDFRKWTGHVNITVDVYDIDVNESGNATLELVDKFLFGFSHEGPSLDFIYMEQTGQRPNNPSGLRMVFRYGCDPSYYGQNCSIDCLVHPNNEQCPDTRPTPPGVTDWMLLLTTTPRGVTDRRCGFTRKPQSSGSGSDGGSQSESCGNGTALTTDGSTEAAKESTTQSVVTATTDILTVSNSLTASHSQSSTIVSSGSLGTQHVSSASYTTDTTASSLDNNVSVSVSKLKTTTEETKSTIQDSLSTLNTPDISYTVIASLVQNTDILTTKQMEISSKPTNHNTYEAGTNTRSPINMLLSTDGASTASELDTNNGSELNSGSYTGIQTNIESSTIGQTTIIGDGTSSNTNDGADIRQATPSIAISMTPGTTTDAGSNPTASDDDGPMAYWPAIVGGVLGALVLVAILTFTVYYRKQKALLKRQDIYNVNPKRWALQPPLENGTTEKSEVALETEQV